MSEQKPIADPRYVFDVEWYDPQADINRFYRLTYFPQESAIEMWDKKMNRTFLKKVEVEGISIKDLYVGATVTIFSRVLKITGYANLATQNLQRSSRESTFAMIKPDCYQHFGKIIDAV